MRDKVIFATTALLISVALFALAVWARSLGFAFGLNRASLVIPACAIMAAARGVSWRRRLVFIGVTLVGCLLVELIPALVGLPILVSGSRTVSVDSSPLQLTVIEFYLSARVVFPVAAMVVFVGRTPSILWTRTVAGERTPPSTPEDQGPTDGG